MNQRLMVRKERCIFSELRLWFTGHWVIELDLAESNTKSKITVASIRYQFIFLSHEKPGGRWFKASSIGAPFYKVLKEPGLLSTSCSTIPSMWPSCSCSKMDHQGCLGGSAVEHLPSPQGVILETQDWVPHRAPCMEPASPSACVSASLSVCL